MIVQVKIAIQRVRLEGSEFRVIRPAKPLWMPRVGHVRS